MTPEDFVEFKKDVVMSSVKAVNETIHANGTGQVLTTAFACGLCVNMVKHNAVPLATAAVCLGCGILISVPIYKSLKAAFKDPSKGFD
jgi:hypothetical protein